MEKVISIHQPCYLPYLGVFYKIWQSDLFIHLDDAQYSNGYVFDWNRIKTPQGECRLKVPTERSFGQSLREVVPKDYLGWREKHLKTLYMNYRRAAHFEEVYTDLESLLLERSYSSLADLNIAITELFIKKFRFGVQTEIASPLHLESRSEARVIELVKRFGGTTYISGTGGKNYQDEKHFEEAGVCLEYSDYRPVEYKQLWGAFAPNMSVVDFAMNEGYNKIYSLFNRTKEGASVE